MDWNKNPLEKTLTMSVVDNNVMEGGRKVLNVRNENNLDNFSK